jgi:hypothetical protein
MEQVEELIVLIQALREMGVIGESVKYSFFERQVQPLHKRCRSGFDYLETEDPLRMFVAELLVGEELRRV